MLITLTLCLYPGTRILASEARGTDDRGGLDGVQAPNDASDRVTISKKTLIPLVAMSKNK